MLNIKSKFKKRLKRLVDKKKIGNFKFRMKINALERMHYAYICYNAAKLAKQLNYDRISVIEYGVAGGRGLLILEQYAEEIKKLLGIKTATKDKRSSCYHGSLYWKSPSFSWWF